MNPGAVFRDANIRLDITASAAKAEIMVKQMPKDAKGGTPAAARHQTEKQAMQL